MDKINETLKAASAAFREKFGEDESICVGDKQIFIFNDCTLIWGVEEGKVNTEFLGEAIKVDMNTGIY